uniref:Outer dense fiber protein 2 n=1 Tax=Astatotilapia calliptera TaxID=8154 RepID=A0AAX7VS16_ASTCA
MRMKTRDSPPSPPPVHLHVLETTPIHVHMRRSPSKTPQSREKGAQVKGDGGRPKVRKPWIPPGRLSCRRDVDSHKCQTSRVRHQTENGIRHQNEAEEQEEELDAVSKDLSILLREQESFRRLRKSDSRGQHRGADVLLRALVEAEIDGVAVANQLTALKETMDSFAKDKTPSKLHAASLERQQKLLLEKIEMFDNTHHGLRQLLREWSEHERESLVRSEQTDTLRKRLADSEADNMRLLAKLTHKEKEASKLAEHLDFEKDNVKTTEELSRILESTRSHLESQLSRAEAEKTRLAAQIQRMHQSQEQQQKELQVLQEELQTLREQREAEERSLALLTEQGERAEEAARRLADKLQEKIIDGEGGGENMLVPLCDRHTSVWFLLHANEFSLRCLVRSCGLCKSDSKESRLAKWQVSSETRKQQR